MHQEEGKAGRRSTQSVPHSAEGKFAPASPLGREEREVLKKISVGFTSFFREEKENFWEKDALLRPVRISSSRYMERGMRLSSFGSFVNVKNIRLVAYTKQMAQRKCVEKMERA